MTKRAVELLSEPTNYAVVQLPERNFPGVVFQGDSLMILLQSLEKIEGYARSNGTSELLEETSFIIANLRQILNSYELVCAQKGIALPY